MMIKEEQEQKDDEEERLKTIIEQENRQFQ